MINQIFLQKEYDYYLSKAKKHNDDNEFEAALMYIAYCADIAYAYPFLECFCDDALESILDNIALQIFKFNKSSRLENRYVFYDAIFADTAGLTQQYIRFLMDINAEVLFIINDKKQLSRGKDILNEIGANSNFRLYVPSSISKVEKAKEIADEIVAFGASKAFLHFTPWDVVGYLVFRNFPEVERYFINLTDHAFWLGKGCSDYFLEFRSAGYNLSNQLRGIEKDRLLFNPYYPIADQVPFEGFDFDVKGKIVGFIGAHLYKLNLDPELKYLHAIKELLLEHDNFIFVIAGFGNTAPLLSFIKNNGLVNKMFFIGKRKDISEVINNVDIYFNSYPFCGGLTTQFAVRHGKPIIGLADESLYSMNALEDLLNVDNYSTPTNFIELKEESRKLINDVEYRNKNIKTFTGSVPSREEFKINLLALIETKKENKHIEIKQLIHNQHDYLSLYLALENDIEKGYFYKKLRFFKSGLKRLGAIDITKTACLALLKNPYKIYSYFKF